MTTFSRFRTFATCLVLLSALAFVSAFPASAATPIVVQAPRAQTAAGNAGCTVSGATVATPSVITCTAAHKLIDGDQVQIINVGGTTTVNTTGFAKVTGQSTTTFALYSDAALTTGVTGTGSYTSGGTVSIVSDISAITGDFTIRLVVSSLTAAKNVVLAIQDSVDGYANSVTLGAVNVSGAITANTPQTFTWRSYQLPSLRINTSNGRLRLSVQSIDGSASVTAALYLEQ
jgi:hypothetical protein